MQDIVSRYPITTLAGKELLAAGEVCSPSNLQAIVKAASNTVQHVKLMGYNTISKDLIDLLTKPPYSVIFAERQVREDVLDVIHKVTVPEPMLDSSADIGSVPIKKPRRSLQCASVRHELSWLQLLHAWL